MDYKCAPSKEFNEGSCFSLNNLINITISFNKLFPDEKIQLKKNKKYLLKNLSLNMKNKFNCDDQNCWLKTRVIENMNNENINFFTFRPDGPEKKFEWLSTNDINNVVFQYEKKYNDFIFFGAVPYDFQELPILDVYNIDFKHLLKNKKNKLGLVINLDRHTDSGSHWVALYTNLYKNEIYFFDSFGKQPGKEIKKFVGKIFKFLYNKEYKVNITNKIIENQHSNLNKFDVRYNKIRHQFKNSECGVYSINFILRLLKCESFDYITENITNDDKMNECRNTYFK